MQIAIVGRRVHRRRGRPAPARHGGVAAQRQARAAPGALARGLREERHLARVRRAPLPVDPGVRRVRLPREPRGELRAPRLRELVAQGASPGGVRRGAHQQPADGLLLARHDREGRRAARRRGPAGARRRERLGLHARGRGQPRPRRDPPALRLGLRLVGGLGEEAGRRVETRAPGSGRSPASRTSSRRARARPARARGAGAGRGARGLRSRTARGDVEDACAARKTTSSAGIDFGEEAPVLPPMSRAEQLVLDYSTTGVAVGDHAMNVVRPHLPPHFKSARDLASTGARRAREHGGAGHLPAATGDGERRRVRHARRRDGVREPHPVGSAPSRRWRHVATTSSMLVAHGKVERDGDVVYVVPDRLEPLALGGMPSASRDFR